MIHKVISGITLLAFVNCLMGCTVHSTDKVPGEAAAQIPPTEKIAELVLLDGTVVKFDDIGGRFGAVSHDVIMGMSPGGDTLTVPITDVWLLRATRPVSLPREALDTAHIAEVVLKNSSLVAFDSSSGSYDKKSGEIRGKAALRKNVSVALRDAISIRSQRPETINLTELRAQPERRLYEVVDKRYNVYTFDSTGGRLQSISGGFYGTSTDGRHVEVAADRVLYAGVERVDPAGTVLASLGVVVGGLAVIFLIALATKQSCPFIYAYDGQQYRFDAEPLGGAICPGLSRTDISRLDYASPIDGEYRLLVRNEVPETQYVDRMTMLLIDHSPATAVYPDLQGKFYAFRNILGATSASDEKGMSLMKFLDKSDKVMWQTHLPSASRDTGTATRHQITVTLPKPPRARKAWLVTNIGTSSWGSNMIRKTVEYRGSTAQAWLSSLTPGSESLDQMNQFLEREEMYHLRTWIKEGTSWKQATTIIGQGPLISEDRVYPIDVSKVAGDSLVLRFQPPKGFWTFDYVGVSYEEPGLIDPVPVKANWAEDQHGNSILDPLSRMDSLRYAMPDVGDYAHLRFNAPAPKEGMARSVYLETSGYYELHMRKDLPDQLARLYNIAVNPGQIVKATMEEFRAWQAQQLAEQSSRKPQ